jgi:hypothetical protein
MATDLAQAKKVAEQGPSDQIQTVLRTLEGSAQKIAEAMYASVDGEGQGGSS